MARTRTRQAVVTAFEEAEGLGSVEVDGEQVSFHCTAITDGTRSIGVGVTVDVELAPGPSGAIEALRVSPS